MSPMHFLFLRMSVALIVMFAISLKYIKLLDRYVVFRGALLGVIIAASHGLGFVGIDRSFATDAAILYAIEPVTSILVARILLKERMDGWRSLSLFLALTGFFILSHISFENFFSNTIFLGNILMLVGVLADGFFSPVAKPVVEKYPARLVLTVALFFATLVLSPFAVLSPVKSTAFSWKAIFSILYLSILCTCVGWTMWLYFLSKLSVNVIAITVFIQPVLGAFIPHFTIGEQIGSRIWFGGSIILLGVAIAFFKRKNTADEMIAEAVIH